jgi:hypothetical protein
MERDSWWERLDWEEVPMWKALKVWANSNRHVKCIDGNCYYYYNGWDEMKISHCQVRRGKWFIEKK